jgi:hypothetical protein
MGNRSWIRDGMACLLGFGEHVLSDQQCLNPI